MRTAWLSLCFFVCASACVIAVSFSGCSGSIGNQTPGADLAVPAVDAGVDLASETDGGACRNGRQDGNETDVDCGGTCDPCSIALHCKLGSDCSSGSCINDTCTLPPTCNDTIKDQDESDVDCGGRYCNACMNGKKCNRATDCVSLYCGNGVCGSSCNDGVKDALETDVDCGGGTCPACAIGKKCVGNADCTTKSCIVGICGVPADMAVLQDMMKPDGAVTDAGTADGGSDAAVKTDGGAVPDAGTVDLATGIKDGGAADGGVADAGVPDAGATADAAVDAAVKADMSAPIDMVKGGG